ncbi:hypothetical protein DXG01_016305 [Tephrocybe rancida]|nr:hypothetical protein DXG01_016305 [Tephrocybe rancida]
MKRDRDASEFSKGVFGRYNQSVTKSCDSVLQLSTAPGPLQFLQGYIISMTTSEITLHVWPSKFGLPSMEPSCLAAVLYLQPLFSGTVSIIECSDPTLSPTGGCVLILSCEGMSKLRQSIGQLPYLTHEQHTVSSLGSIIKYVAGLKVADATRSSFNLDLSLSGTEKSQTTAWCAHVESNLGDIVSYVLYSNQSNWAKLTHPTLASMYPLPQRYYVPGRIREMYRPRLETAGLWDLPTKEEEKKTLKEAKIKQKDQNTKTFQETFGREKVLEKARASLDIYARLVGERDFIFGKDKPTTLDIVLAAHILLLLEPEFPDTSIQSLIKDSYPTLASHAWRVLNHVTIPGEPLLRTCSTPSFAWSSLLPSPPMATRNEKPSEEDLHFRRMRWGFYGLTLGTLGVYLLTSYQALISRRAKTNRSIT